MNGTITIPCRCTAPWVTRERGTMQITMLGTGAPLMPDRATTGLLVTAEGCQPLLIDTCGGFELARQLASFGIPLASIKNVVATHRHMDHIGGMQALLIARQPLDVYASCDTHAGITQLKAACFPEWAPHTDVRRHEVAAGVVREIGGFRVEFYAAVHRVPTLAVRVTLGAKSFAFSADTRPTPAIVAAARDVDLFVCDAICAEADGETAAARARDLMHPTAREAAAMAADAGSGHLVCTHIGRFGSVDGILTEARSVFRGPVSLPGDGARFVV